jgi:hypothetical protein
MSPASVRTALILLFPLYSHSHAAFEASVAGPRSVSLGNAMVATPPDGWTPFTNPAGLAFCHVLSLGAFHDPGLFGLPELSISGVALSIPVGRVGLAVSADWFGWDLYRETSLQVAFGREVSSAIGLGVRCRMNRLTIRGYGSCTAFTFDLGIRIECSRSLAIGGVLTNVTSAVLCDSDEPLPQELRGGIWYAPVPDLHIVVEAGKELLSAPEIRCGVEFDILTELTLRAGIIDAPSIVSGGCAFHLGEFTAEYALSYHWVLGVTHEMGLTVSLP